MATPLDQWLDKAQLYQEDLGLSEGPFADMDEYMILEVMTWKVRSTVPKSVLKTLDSSEVPKGDSLEFIGDAVLHIVYTTMLAENPIAAGKMTKIRSEMERNTQLAAYGTDIGLCDPLNECRRSGKCGRDAGKTGKTDKSCADIFESLVGAMYMHLYYQKGMGYSALEEISRWLDNLDVQTLMATLYDMYE